MMQDNSCIFTEEYIYDQCKDYIGKGMSASPYFYTFGRVKFGVILLKKPNSSFFSLEFFSLSPGLEKITLSGRCSGEISEIFEDRFTVIRRFWIEYALREGFDLLNPFTVR